MQTTVRDTIVFDLGRGTLNVPAGDLLQAWLQQEIQQRASAPLIAPALGQCWPGTTDIYAGLVRGLEGQRDYHLLVHEEVFKPGPWQAAVDWAPSLGEQYSVPDRRESRILVVNVSELFAGEWYWTNAQYAGYADYAWAQNFGDGIQLNYRKANKFPARAVRRLII